MKVPVGYAVGVTLLATSRIVEISGDRWDTAASWTQTGVTIAATLHVVAYGVDRLVNVTRRLRRAMRMADDLNEGGTVDGTDAGAA
ncbi:hypothetical protein ACIBKX_14050 [Streptomyces sp. NPDC050658]|uniref:hypothetical protein n=1 Tax=unclassified Streptomyces TaxID=2593676 RepID=UPI0034307270